MLNQTASIVKGSQHRAALAHDLSNNSHLPADSHHRTCEVPSSPGSSSRTVLCWSVASIRDPISVSVKPSNLKPKMRTATDSVMHSRRSDPLVVVVSDLPCAQRVRESIQVVYVERQGQVFGLGSAQVAVACQTIGTCSTEQQAAARVGMSQNIVKTIIGWSA